MTIRQLCAGVIAAGAAAGCGSAATAPSSPAPSTPTPGTPAPTLISIEVSGPSLQIGARLQYEATARYSDGSTRSIAAQASWQSSNQSVVVVEAGGAASGVDVGEADIAAALSGVSGTMHVKIVDTPPVFSQTVVDVSGIYDPAAMRLGALDCTYVFPDTPDDRWCFNVFGNTSIPNKIVPSFDYKVADLSVPVVAATAGVVTAVVPHEEDGMFPGEYAIDTKPSSHSSYLVEYDHVKNVSVHVGSVVSPGTPLGTVGWMRPGATQGRVEMQFNHTLSTNPYQAVSLCPATFGTPQFNDLNNAALAANNIANPGFSHPTVCATDMVPARVERSILVASRH